MGQYIGHNQCYDVLDSIMRAYESGGYTRLVQYAQGQSVLMDSKPAPGYVPGVQGKRETGVEYIPNADGTRIHIYYLSGQKSTPHQRQEAQRALRSGFDSHEIMGTLVSIRRVGESIQLQFVAGNRDNVENGVITNKVSLRSVSVTREPAEKGGLIVAMSFDQMLGIPYHQLESMLRSEMGSDVTAVSEHMRELRRRALEPEQDRRPVPRQLPDRQGRQP